MTNARASDASAPDTNASDPKGSEDAKTASPALPVVIVLTEPVSYGPAIHERLTFARTRRVKDLIAADAVKSIAQKEAAVYASMADVPLPVILDLSSDDYDALAEKVAPLLGNSWEAAKQEWMTQAAINMGMATGIQEEFARRAREGATA